MWACVPVVIFVPIVLFGCGGNPTPGPTPVPPTPVPPTPVPPSPVPPTPHRKPCTETEWDRILHLEEQSAYLQCLPSCIDGSSGALDTACVAKCLQLNNTCTASCANCVADYCITGKPECPICYKGTPAPTPSPTPSPGEKCSDAEWKIAAALGDNTEYFKCDEQLQCWDGFGELNKECVETCLKIVHIGNTCAECIVDHCFQGNCEVCNPGATPAPSPYACEDWERSIVTGLDSNPKYLECDLQLGCWDANTHELNIECARTCMVVAGLTNECAHCMAESCFKSDCEKCFPASTPVPTPSAGSDCSPDDWTIVTGLAKNDNYLKCDETNHCWNGYGDYNKTCVSSCMVEANITKVCADCVVNYCPNLDCPLCFKITPTPAPTSAHTVCKEADKNIIFHLHTNTAYEKCLITNGCIKDMGSLVDEQCMSKCLKTVNCSAACADCVTTFCLSTHTQDASCLTCAGEWPTPVPTPTPLPTEVPCGENDWTIVNNLGNDTKWITCTDSLGCKNQYGRIDPHCMKTCLLADNVTNPCAVCIAENSPHGDWAVCHYGTPDPTYVNCTNTEWLIVEGLETNSEYVNCDDQLECWNGFGELNRECVATCMQHVGLSSVCAHCVVDECFNGNCDACHPPAPTPSPGPDAPKCSVPEWDLVLELDSDVKYLTCIESLGCWDDVGTISVNCWKTCLQLVGCSSVCANCVANECLHGNCDACHGKITPTPAPVPPLIPCNSTDWKVVSTLADNSKYVKCEEDHKCYKEDGDFDPKCIADCLATLGIDQKCAICVVKSCHSTVCPTCYAGNGTLSV